MHLMCRVPAVRGPYQFRKVHLFSRYWCGTDWWVIFLVFARYVIFSFAFSLFTGHTAKVPTLPHCFSSRSNTSLTLPLRILLTSKFFSLSKAVSCQVPGWRSVFWHVLLTLSQEEGNFCLCFV